MASRRAARRRARAGSGIAAGILIGTLALQAGVVPSRDKLTDDEKIEILRNLSAEYGKAKTYIPRSKKPLAFDAKDGTWDQAKWQMEAQQNGGPAAREGDQVKITHVEFATDKLIIEINGGLKSGMHWYDHIEAGMGGMTRPMGNGDYTPSMGSSIEVNFHKPLENLTSDQVKKVLSPLIDFDKHSVTKVYSETLPPEVQNAITEKRALEGMTRDEVLMAMGHPRTKYRYSRDDTDYEDWIYGGDGPGKVTFVTFTGPKVVKVKESYAGLGAETKSQQVITP